MPDIILLDVKMPQTTGFDAIRRIKADARYMDIPVVFLTASGSEASEIEGLSLGAVDFINKPCTPAVLRKRIDNHIRTHVLTTRLHAMVAKRRQQIEGLHNRVISNLADIVESRDSDTGGHIQRTSSYIGILYDALLAAGLYNDVVRTWDRSLLILSAQLHDLGKVAIPDAILNKPGPLSEAEFELMKNHTTIGRDMIARMRKTGGGYLKDAAITESGTGRDFLRYAEAFAYTHHEKWDGSGYPQGIRGEAIPLEGRMMAIADVYDALVSARPYKQPFSHERAIEIIKSDAGTHFDPIMVELFLREEAAFDHVRCTVSPRAGL
jgi:putative two-component system response regulator